MGNRQEVPLLWLVFKTTISVDYELTSKLYEVLIHAYSAALFLFLNYHLKNQDLLGIHLSSISTCLLSSLQLGDCIPYAVSYCKHLTTPIFSFCSFFFCCLFCFFPDRSAVHLSPEGGSDPYPKDPFCQPVSDVVLQQEAHV